MDPADSLKLLTRVEDGLHQEEMCRLDQVEAVSAGLYWQQENVDRLQSLKVRQVFLQGDKELASSEVYKS